MHLQTCQDCCFENIKIGGAGGRTAVNVYFAKGLSNVTAVLSGPLGQTIARIAAVVST